MDIASLFTVIFILSASIFLVLVSFLGVLWATAALCRRCCRKRVHSSKDGMGHETGIQETR